MIFTSLLMMTSLVGERFFFLLVVQQLIDHSLQANPPPFLASGSTLRTVLLNNRRTDSRNVKLAIMFFTVDFIRCAVPCSD